MPPSPKEYKIFSRINLRFQEVFTTGYNKTTGLPLYSWHVAKSYITKDTIKRLEAYIKTFQISDHIYKSGGADQVNITVASKDDAVYILNDKDCTLAAKVFNLRCMRKGAQPYANTHCFALADILMPRNI